MDISIKKHSQPDKWFSNLTPLENTKLASDETIAMVMHYEMFTILPKLKTKTHSVFAVIRKGNKVIARNYHCHEILGKIMFSKGKGTNIAEYPIENEKELIEELTSDALEIGKMLAIEKDIPLKLNTAQPAFLIITPSNSTNKRLLEIFAKDKAPEGDIGKKVITNLLGLEKIPSTPTKKKQTKTNLERAKEETDLIKKYGKKRILNLAKKIYYKGETINKNAKPPITINNLIKNINKNEENY